MRFDRRGLLVSVALAALCGITRAEPVTSAGPAVKEVQLATGAFARGTALPAWSLPLAEVPATTRTNAVVLRLAETQMSAVGGQGFLTNRAVQVNDASALAA